MPFSTKGDEGGDVKTVPTIGQLYSILQCFSIYILLDVMNIIFSDFYQCAEKKNALFLKQCSMFGT
jgi:hypothetical protein